MPPGTATLGQEGQEGPDKPALLSLGFLLSLLSLGFLLSQILSFRPAGRTFARDFAPFHNVMAHHGVDPYARTKRAKKTE